MHYFNEIEQGVCPDGENPHGFDTCSECGAEAAPWEQAERDAAARRAGQRSPSEKTWALVLSKLETQKKAA